MSLHQIRYVFEHRILPQGFFEDKEKFIGLLLKDKSVLYRIIDDIFQKQNIVNPYTQEQFDIEVGRITNEVMMMKIIMPEPEEEPLCFCQYLFFDKTFEKISFFCIERGTEAEDAPFVCSWQPDGSHCNYGGCSFENYGDFLKCADIHMNRTK